MVRHKHTSLAQFHTSLKRAHRHQPRMISMPDQHAPCAGFAQQLIAVEKAVVDAKQTLICDHVDHCLSSPAKDPDTDDLIAIKKYL
ncbi:metal-sensing transcriptional repressor [Ruegeria atlantica]|uniref:metal-sensing transcriptional repressor n=1 Tax=Ruegeria atlantica TaxID=81569 RepID=UPI00147D4916|nr:metal-sensing transcriptional repressor [Ruegeria atlantica]